MLQQLWTESTKPKSLDSLDYHAEISEILRKLAKNSDFPHLLFYGPNGAGKKTRVLAFLKEVYGSGIYTVTEEEKEYKINETSNTTTSCTVLSSKFHIDVAPSDADHHDKVIIQKLIKEVASSHQVNSKQTKDFKVVIINEVDNLTKEAQASLRRTMEKYIERCRIILICESLAKIINPIRSRCLLIRIPAPDQTQVAQILDKISIQYNCKISQQLINKIAIASNGNLREAILYLQSTRVNNTCIKDDQNIAAQEWKLHIQHNIVMPIVKNQIVETMKEIREKFYQLLVNCIPVDTVIVYLFLLFFLQNQTNLFKFILKIKGNYYLNTQTIIELCLKCFKEYQINIKIMLIRLQSMNSSNRQQNVKIEQDKDQRVQFIQKHQQLNI